MFGIITYKTGKNKKSSLSLFPSRKNRDSTSPNDKSWSPFSSSYNTVKSNNDDSSEEITAPLKDRNENSFKRKDSGNANLSKDNNTKKPKDLRSLLLMSHKDDIDFLRKSVEDSIKTTELNEYFVNLPAIWSVKERNRLKQLMQNEYVGFKEELYGENTVMKISNSDLDKLRRNLKLLEIDNQDPDKLLESELSFKDCYYNDPNDTNSDTTSRSSSNADLDVNSLTGPTFSRRKSYVRSKSFTEVQRFTSNLFPPTNINNTYSQFPPRKLTIIAPSSNDDLTSEHSLTPRDGNSGAYSPRDHDSYSPRPSPLTVLDIENKARLSLSPSTTLLTECLAKTHIQSAKTINKSTSPHEGIGFISIDHDSQETCDQFEYKKSKSRSGSLLKIKEDLIGIPSTYEDEVVTQTQSLTIASSSQDRSVTIATANTDNDDYNHEHASDLHDSFHELDDNSPLNFHVSPSNESTDRGLLESSHNNEMEMSPHFNSSIMMRNQTQSSAVRIVHSNHSDTDKKLNLSDHSDVHDINKGGSLFRFNMHDNFSGGDLPSSFLDDFSPVPFSCRFTGSSSGDQSRPFSGSGVGIGSLRENTQNNSGNSAFKRNFPVITRKTIRKSKSETFTCNNNRASSNLITPGGPSNFLSQPSPNKEAFETPLNMCRLSQTDEDKDWGLSLQAKPGLINMLIMMYRNLEPNEDWTVVYTVKPQLISKVDSVTASTILNVKNNLSARRHAASSPFDSNNVTVPIASITSNLTQTNRPISADLTGAVYQVHTAIQDHESSGESNEFTVPTPTNSTSTKNAKNALFQRIQDAKRVTGGNKGVSFANTNEESTSVDDTQSSDITHEAVRQQSLCFDSDKSGSYMCTESQKTFETNNSSNNNSCVKDIKNKAKWRRMTMAHTKAKKSDMSMHMYMDPDQSSYLDRSGSNSSFLHNAPVSTRRGDHDSPTIVSKILQKNQRRQSNIHSRKTLDMSSVLENSHISESENAVDECNFKGIIIGGSYQQCFDDNLPVIAMPLASEKRILESFIRKDGSLLIKLYIPKDEVVKEVNFQKDAWVIQKASPDGYLVSKEKLVKSKRIICYFLTKYPTSTISSSTLSTVNENMEEANVYESTELQEITQTQGEQDDAVLHIKNTDWNNSIIISNILIYLSFEELMNQSVMTVSKLWALAYYRVTAKRLSQSSVLFEYPQWKNFISNNSWGKFLSSGACKDVFAVQSKDCRLQAVSISDIYDLEERDMDELIEKELEISMLCSSLISLKICPNFVEIYSTFRSKFPAPSQKYLSVGKQSSGMIWDKSFPAPKSYTSLSTSDIPTMSKIIKQVPDGNYQFIKMEFCTGGDVEEYIRGVKMLSIETTRSMLFQMAFSLYCAREQLGLRHFDLKLLNFFVTDSSGLISQNDKNNSAVLKIGFEEEIFDINIPNNTSELVKLADFGTGEITSKSLNDYITVQQFTTLENSPPEYLLIGSAARQAYSADTFCLGLSYLHLLTGHAPYEELLADVKCPKFFKDQLVSLWETKDTCSDYYIIHEVINSLDDSYDEEEYMTHSDKYENEDSSKCVLYHTLYRYLVLLHGCDIFPNNENDTSSSNMSSLSSSHTWKICVHALGLENRVDNKPVQSKRITSSLAACRNQYLKDSSLWSIKTGSHPIMVNVRDRLKDLGEDAEKILFEMLNFDPSKRCSMYDVLKSSIFDCLKNSKIATKRNKKPTSVVVEPNVVEYMHYYTVASNKFTHISRL